MPFYKKSTNKKPIPMTIYNPSKFEIAFTNFSHFVLRRYYKRFVKTLELQPNDKVIDFGSGTGFLSNLISKELVGRESWLSCVEISEKWNNIARKKIRRYPNVDFYCGMLYELDMKENYYDKIVIHWVLHDVGKKHRGKVVEAMAKRLKKSGRIILREPIKEDHGIPVSQIKELMKNVGMVEVESQLIDNHWVGTVLAGVFEKK